LNWRWLPFVATKYQPSSLSMAKISEIFIGYPILPTANVVIWFESVRVRLRRKDSGYPEHPPQSLTRGFPVSVPRSRFRASERSDANTARANRFSVIRGLAMPSFARARLKAGQAKLACLPPRRLSHLNKQVTACWKKRHRS
jgi:hypothetical protein